MQAHPTIEASNAIRVPQTGNLLIKLPSDSQSPTTPLLLANAYVTFGVRDFHPIDCAHAGHTIE